jgi:hypothetical protein
MNTLPEEVLRKIYHNVYDSVVDEIEEFYDVKFWRYIYNDVITEIEEFFYFCVPEDTPSDEYLYYFRSCYRCCY